MTDKKEKKEKVKEAKEKKATYTTFEVKVLSPFADITEKHIKSLLKCGLNTDLTIRRV
jgi:hypothetical protein